MSTLLVVHHTPSPNVAEVLAAMLSGGAEPELDEVEVLAVPALAATADHVLRADGYCLLTPANFGYMSGALKHFFDTTFYTCQTAVAGRPYAACVHGGGDSTGAVASVRTLAEAWGLAPVAEPLTVVGGPDAAARAAAAELCATVAAHLVTD